MPGNTIRRVVAGCEKKLTAVLCLPWITAVAFLAYTRAQRAIAQPQLEGDTGVLIGGIHAAHSCLKHHRWISCPGVRHYPVFQYLPGWILHLGGAKDPAIAHFFAYLAFVSFLATLALLIYALFSIGNALGAWLATAALLGSYLLHYSNSSFNEAVAAFLTLAFTWGCIRRASPGWIATLFVLTGITKEIAPPFLLAIGVLTALPRLNRPWIISIRRDRPYFLSLMLGFVCAIGINALFNVFRFGSPLNTYNLQPMLRVPDLGQQLISWAGLWFSPNGGLVVFATGTLVLIVAVAIVVLRDLITRRVGPLASLPVLGAILILSLITFGLASWYAPFGWWAWGPRLVLPWLPSILLIVLAFHPLQLIRAMSPVLSDARLFLFVVGLFCVTALPHAAVDYSDALQRFFIANPDCPRIIHIQIEPQAYYQCINRMMWPEYFFLTRPLYSAALSLPAFWVCGAYLIVLGGLCSGARQWVIRHADTIGNSQP